MYWKLNKGKGEQKKHGDHKVAESAALQGPQIMILFYRNHFF